MDFVIWETRLNASGGCEAAVTARVRIGWVKFMECGELLLGNRFPLRMKGKVYRCCAERAMVRAMCDQKVVSGRQEDD